MKMDDMCAIPIINSNVIEDLADCTILNSHNHIKNCYYYIRAGPVYLSF